MHRWTRFIIVIIIIIIIYLMFQNVWGNLLCEKLKLQQKCKEREQKPVLNSIPLCRIPYSKSSTLPSSTRNAKR